MFVVKAATTRAYVDQKVLTVDEVLVAFGFLTHLQNYCSYYNAKWYQSFLSVCFVFDHWNKLFRTQTIHVRVHFVA